MRVMEEMAEMMARDKEEGWTEVAEDYEGTEYSEWLCEDVKLRSASDEEEDFMELNFNEDGVMNSDFLDDECMKAVNEDAVSKEVMLVEDNRGMGVIEIVLIIVVLIGLVVVFNGGISKVLDTIIKGISDLADGFFVK